MDAMPTLRDLDIPTRARSELIDIRAFIATIRRNMRPILFVVLLVLGLTYFAYVRADRIYTATARVALDRQVEEIVSVDGRTGLSTDSPAVDTEVQILKSSPVAAAVVERLGLNNVPGFGFPEGGNPPFDPQQAKARAVEVVRNSLDVKRDGASYAISISYSAKDPKLAAAIPNAAVEAYRGGDRMQKSLEREQDITVLRDRLVTLRSQLMQAEAAVARYRAATNLVDIQKDSTAAQETLSVLATQFADAQAQQAVAEARLAAIGASGGPAADALSSGVLGQLRSQQAGLSAQRADLAGRYGDRHPTLSNINRQLADVNREIAQEINRIETSLLTEAQVARDRSASIQASISQARGELLAGNNASVRLGELQRTAESARVLYQALLERYREAVAGQGTERSRAYPIAAATLPRGPISPNRTAYLLGGGIAALLAAAGVVILVELFRRGFQSRRDVESKLKIPLLALIPDLKTVPDGRRAGKTPLGAADHLVEHNGSVFSESFRSIRAALKVGQEGQVARAVAITSALPGEGKTTTAICLARSAALAGQRVVLVDCDLRQRASSRQLTEGIEAGLVEVLKGEARLDQALVRDSSTGAYLLPQKGSDQPHYDVIASREMEELIAQLTKQFDLVILDTAPVLPVAESRAVSAMADSALLVVRWRKTTIPAAQMALRHLERAGARVGGALLSLVDLHRQARSGLDDEAYYYASYKKYYA